MIPVQRTEHSIDGLDRRVWSMRLVLIMSLILNALLLACGVWVVNQVGTRPLAEQIGIVEPRRPAYDFYAEEKFTGLPGTKVAVVGDSQAEYGPWSELLGQPVAVRGQAGALTSEITGWVEFIPEGIETTFIFTGSNDVLHGTPINQVRQKAEELYRKVPGQGVAVGVPPLEGRDEQVAAVNAALHEAAAAAGIEWFDPTHVLAAPESIRHDGVHLTGQGYSELTQSLMTTFPIAD
ncbi:GDSL-type esterase/lipase family protein [Micrococcus luteus]|uniref:GDSL-type esterase/lipase family protein n=1 Tax=Micrococcus luteus TaxID=1270 RepID=UPI00056169EB|nr:GDSL-type esterase/lipase family protein [Micrococcus luteus]